MPDLLDLLINLSAAIPGLIKFMQAICMIMALWLVGNGILELYAVSNENSSKFLSGRVKYSISGGILSIVIGGFFVLLSGQELINITTRTLTGDYTTSQILIYKVKDGLTSTDKGKLALSAIFSILQMVGVVAYIKALWIFKNSEKNPNSSIGKGMCFLIGGMAAWNAEWCMNVINNQLGINLIGLFFS